MSEEIELADLTYRFADSEQPIFEHLDHTFNAGCWSSILGASGCGKTTLLKLIADLQQSAGLLSGNVHINSDNKGVAYMGQKDFLFPWLDVLHNTCLESYLRTGQISADEQARAVSLLTQLGLKKAITKKPKQLSGGMRQRVALARTLMQDKPVVLMDEPFSALDALTRYELQDLACQLLIDKTVVFITHDVQEALRVSDAVLVMRGQPAQLFSVDIPYAQSKPRMMDGAFARAQQQLMNELNQGLSTEVKAHD